MATTLHRGSREDAHQMIVDDVGQMVGRHTVSFEKDLVVHVVCVHAHPTADSVLETNLVVAGSLMRTT